MKLLRMYGEFDMMVADQIADWDHPAHDWERRRFEAMRDAAVPETVLWVVGAEIGWMATTYTQFVDPARMVLIEPAPEAWPTLRAAWRENGLVDPAMCVDAFASDMNAGISPAKKWRPWPKAAEGVESPDRHYRYLFEDKHVAEVRQITLDTLARVAPEPPTMLSIDVEGAEGIVLAGAAELLRAHRPDVFVSVHPDLIARDYPQHELKYLWAAMGDLDYHRDLIAVEHEEHWRFTPKERIR